MGFLPFFEADGIDCILVKGGLCSIREQDIIGCFPSQAVGGVLVLVILPNAGVLLASIFVQVECLFFSDNLFNIFWCFIVLTCSASLETVGVVQLIIEDLVARSLHNINCGCVNEHNYWHVVIVTYMSLPLISSSVMILRISFI